MECQGPEWIRNLFTWLDDGRIPIEIMNNAMNWLYTKGIIICIDVKLV